MAADDEGDRMKNMTFLEEEQGNRTRIVKKANIKLE